MEYADVVAVVMVARSSHPSPQPSGIDHTATQAVCSGQEGTGR